MDQARISADLKKIARESYDRIVGLALADIAVDGCITKAPGGGQCARPSPVDRRKQGMKRSLMVEGCGIPLGRVLAPANRHDSPLLAPTLDKLDDLGPLPDDITVHLDAGYNSQKTRDELAGRGLTGDIAHKGEKAPIQAGQRWPVERTNAWHNSFNRLQRCYERNEDVIDAFFDLADAIITVRRLIREASTLPMGQPPSQASMNTDLFARCLWRVAEDNPDSDLYAESSDADTVMGYITARLRHPGGVYIHWCFSGMAIRAWEGYKSVGTSLKASCISAAVEKRSACPGHMPS